MSFYTHTATRNQSCSPCACALNLAVSAPRDTLENRGLCPDLASNQTLDCTCSLEAEGHCHFFAADLGPLSVSDECFSVHVCLPSAAWEDDCPESADARDPGSLALRPNIPLFLRPNIPLILPKRPPLRSLSLCLRAASLALSLSLRSLASLSCRAVSAACLALSLSRLSLASTSACLAACLACSAAISAGDGPGGGTQGI